MKLDYFDIHSHPNFPQYDEDRGELISRMINNSVGTVSIGTDYKTSRESVELADKNENIWAAIGLHPADDNGVVFDEERYIELVSNPKVVAIGECGLDFFHIKDDTSRKNQRKDFGKQIEFAIKHNKPLMIHSRDTYDEVYQILLSYSKSFGEKLRGNMHFFVGDVPMAKKFLDINFSISFTGVITFVRDYDETIKYIPKDKIMAETDAPYVSPVPYRGKRNEPSYVIEVYKKLAEIRGSNFEDLRIQINNNVTKSFGIEMY